MSPTQSIYLLNVIICANLAVIATYTWIQAERERSLGTFAAAAWLFVVTDVAFLFRDDMAFWVGRFYPTLLVTVGHVTLLVGAQRLAGKVDSFLRDVAIIPAHAVALGLFLVLSGGVSAFRTASNSLLWAALAFAAANAIRRAVNEDVRVAMRLPALVFVIHGVFHLLRALVSLATIGTAAGTPGWLQFIGDMEVSAFMTSLFLALMVGYNQIGALRLLRTDRELRALQAFLPICAWCRDVRHDGKWQKLEEFFAARENVQVTHGMCESCESRMMREL